MPSVILTAMRVKSLCVYVSHHVHRFATPWTAGRQAPLSTEFSRQESCGGLPFSLAEDLPDPDIEPGSPALHADSLPSEPRGKPYNNTMGEKSQSGFDYI